MNNQRSDGQNKSASAYKRSVRAYLLAHDEVASKQELRAGTDVPAWYIDQIGSTTTFYTSLNHDRDYVASKHLIGHRSTHDGFWRPQVDDGVAVFHCKKTQSRRSNTSHSSGRPDSLQPKPTTASTAAATAHSVNSPNKMRFMSLPSTTQRSTPTAGRPCRTPNSASAKPTNLPTSRRPTQPTTAFSIATSFSRCFDQPQTTRFTQPQPRGPLHSFCGSSRATRLRPSNAVSVAITRSRTRSTTASQGMSPTGHPSGEPSTISTRTNSAIACSRCVARCSTITSTAVSSS